MRARLWYIHIHFMLWQNRQILSQAILTLCPPCRTFPYPAHGWLTANRKIYHKTAWLFHWLKIDRWRQRIGWGQEECRKKLGLSLFGHGGGEVGWQKARVLGQYRWWHLINIKTSPSSEKRLQLEWKGNIRRAADYLSLCLMKAGWLLIQRWKTKLSFHNGRGLKQKMSY